jgi:aldose 1-epimerase
VTRAPFGTAPAGDADLFTLTNTHGALVRVTNYGAIVVSVLVPDRRGRLADVVLGYDSLEGYLRDPHYIGAVVGRFANRIANARFTLDVTTYRLTANEGRHHLHGGRVGLSRVFWRADPFGAEGAAGLALSYTSPDGEEGYPGSLQVRVTYTLTERNELVVDYLATTDRPTPVNLTQHSYFNLAGKGDVLGHLLQIRAAAMVEVDESLIPTGAIAPLAGGPFDFREPTAVGARIAARDERLARAGGYDHSFVLDRSGPGAVHAARVVEPVSGRVLDLHTTEPCVHLYTGNGLDGKVLGKTGRAYGRHEGLCLETQHYADSPNREAFPSTILRPGAEYRSRTVFAFGVTD